MSLLAELGLDVQAGLMLVSPPDHVLAEAGLLSPRPAVAPSLRHAEPSRCIAWWPERGELLPESLSRLHWMVSIGQGHAWLVADADDDGITADDLRGALAGTDLAIGEERRLESGGIALRCIPS
jgi:hypothetical protein